MYKQDLYTNCECHVHLEYERISASTRDVHDHEQLVYKSSVNMYSVVMYVAT